MKKGGRVTVSYCKRYGGNCSAPVCKESEGPVQLEMMHIHPHPA